MVRVVSENEAGRFTLIGFDRSLKKALGIEAKELVARTAPICQAK